MFVNEARGLDLATCGTHEEPCKILQMAVTQVEHSGTVYIDGNQHIKQTITLSKSISICGLSNISASILKASKRISGSTYVFQTETRVNVSFFSLEGEITTWIS